MYHADIFLGQLLGTIVNRLYAFQPFFKGIRLKVKDIGCQLQILSQAQILLYHAFWHSIDHEWASIFIKRKSWIRLLLLKLNNIRSRINIQVLLELVRYQALNILIILHTSCHINRTGDDIGIAQSKESILSSDSMLLHQVADNVFESNRVDNLTIQYNTFWQIGRCHLDNLQLIALLSSNNQIDWFVSEVNGHQITLDWFTKHSVRCMHSSDRLARRTTAFLSKERAIPRLSRHVITATILRKERLVELG